MRPWPNSPDYPEWLQHLNKIEWIASNILVFYIAIALIVFVVGYFALFDPRATTGGKLIFNFALSLVGVIGLVFLGIYVDPHPDQMWFDFPQETAWWRPTVRILAYGWVAYTVTALTVVLALRKWYPHKIKVAPVLENSLVRLRQRSKKN